MSSLFVLSHLCSSDTWGAAPHPTDLQPHHLPPPEEPLCLQTRPQLQPLADPPGGVQGSATPSVPTMSGNFSHLYLVLKEEKCFEIL
ncbi:hypothetical protein E2C01_011714 [Portunus trituberculatus]|uniref:Uncharacterized protein n=1 Tax=Portunus trituberculatus TaxID=210409 RepID=A0A5B7DC16_PORTR|nr:hypothetical protein [Portunus trituberculatus]